MIRPPTRHSPPDRKDENRPEHQAHEDSQSPRGSSGIGNTDPTAATLVDPRLNVYPTTLSASTAAEHTRPFPAPPALTPPARAQPQIHTRFPPSHLKGY